jgi:PAS domain S-box-containing protein
MGQLMCHVVIPPAHREALEHGMRDYRTSGNSALLLKRFETTALRRDGSEFPVELFIVPFTSGNEVHFLGSFHDISDRKALEANQASTTATLQRALSELAAQQLALDEHAIVSMTDLQGNITYANEKFLQVSQYKLEELLGNNHRMLKSGLQDEAFYEDMWSTIAFGGVWHGEIANRRKDGSLYWVTSTIVPILDEHGLPWQYISIRTDITDQKATQLELSSTVEKYQETELRLAQAYAREIVFGNQIQRTLLFGDIPAQLGPMEVAVYTEPSMGIDGDFYDYVSYSPSRFDIVIGDVMGKGVPAALLGAAVKQEINRVIARQANHGGFPDTFAGPAQIVNRLHHTIGPRLIALDTFVTMAYLRFDLESERLRFVDAGHTQIILAGDEGLRLLTGDNLPLGVMENERYAESEAAIAPGDLIFIYSDGFTEARNADGEAFGVARLSQLVASLRRHNLPAPVLVDIVRQAVQDFQDEATPSDDRTCMALRYRGTQDGASLSTTLNLPWRLDGLAPLRHGIASLASQAGLTDTARDSLILAAFEAATNIVRHGNCSLPDNGIHCSIEDAGDRVVVTLYHLGGRCHSVEKTPDFSGQSEGGFGLFIIRNSVDEVVYDNPAPGFCCVRMTKYKAAHENG